MNEQNQKLKYEQQKLQQQIQDKGQERESSRQLLIDSLKRDKEYLRNKLNREILNHNTILQQKDQDLENERKHQNELFQSKIKALQFEHIQQIKQKENEKLELQNKLVQLQNQLQYSKKDNVILETEYKKQIAQLEKDLYYHNDLVQKYRSQLNTFQQSNQCLTNIANTVSSNPSQLPQNQSLFHSTNSKLKDSIPMTHKFGVQNNVDEKMADNVESGLSNDKPQGGSKLSPFATTYLNTDSCGLKGRIK